MEHPGCDTGRVLKVELLTQCSGFFNCVSLVMPWDFPVSEIHSVLQYGSPELCNLNEFCPVRRPYKGSCTVVAFMYILAVSMPDAIGISPYSAEALVFAFDLAQCDYN